MQSLYRGDEEEDCVWEPITPGEQNRREIAALRGLALSALATLALVLAFLASGCGGSSGGATMSYSPGSAGNGAALPPTSEPGEPAPRRYTVTPEGVHLHYPVWLDAHPARMADLLAYLRDVVPEADSRIAAGTVGVPVGTTVVVLDPGPYYAPYSPTALASGEFRAPSTIYVAWRSGSSGPVVPALPHEMRHLLTGDPAAGH